MTTASVKVILCPSLYNIEDFWKVCRVPIRSTTLVHYPLSSENYFLTTVFAKNYHFVLSLCYRSRTVNSNTVNSKFHFIRSFCEIFSYHFLFKMHG